jgi:hypothetical protein
MLRIGVAYAVHAPKEICNIMFLLIIFERNQWRGAPGEPWASVGCLHDFGDPCAESDGGYRSIIRTAFGAAATVLISGEGARFAVVQTGGAVWNS